MSSQWKITAPYGYIVELTFKTFKTQSGVSGCTSDTLLIYNGNLALSSSLLGKYCGSYLPPKVYSSGTSRSLLLKFSSDYLIQYQGFKIESRAKNQVSWQTMWICDKILLWIWMRISNFCKQNSQQVFGHSFFAMVIPIFKLCVFGIYKHSYY